MSGPRGGRGRQGAIGVDHDAGLAVATVSSPPLNLFDPPVAPSLEGAVAELEFAGARAVLFRAEGRSCSAGPARQSSAAADPWGP